MEKCLTANFYKNAMQNISIYLKIKLSVTYVYSVQINRSAEFLCLSFFYRWLSHPIKIVAILKHWRALWCGELENWQNGLRIKEIDFLFTSVFSGELHFRDTQVRRRKVEYCESLFYLLCSYPVKYLILFFPP